jgi:hypothetical protein
MGSLKAKPPAKGLPLGAMWQAAQSAAPVRYSPRATKSGAASRLTLAKSTSSSSAMSMGIEVYVPCPISTCGMISVLSSGRMRTKAFGLNISSLEGWTFASIRTGT